MSTVGSQGRPHLASWSGLVSDEADAEIGLLGVPFDGATSYRKGCAHGPPKMRDLSQHLARCAQEGEPLTLRVKDYGDVPPDLEWHRFFQTVEEQAAEVLRHPFALFLGGDHSVSIPLMRAFAHIADGPLGVVHFDAHLDLFDSYDGHPWSHACTARRALELPGLEPGRLIFVGVRSFCEEEWQVLRTHPEISYHTARDCYKHGMEAIALDVIEKLRAVSSVYLTVDIDGLDPAYAPGTGTPEGGGATTQDLLELIRGVCHSLPVRAMDIVEVAPPLDHSDITSFAALKIIYEAWWALQEKSGFSSRRSVGES